MVLRGWRVLFRSHDSIDRALNTSRSVMKARTLKEKITTWAVTVLRLGPRHERCPSVYSFDPLNSFADAGGVGAERNWPSFHLRASVDPISRQSPLYYDFGDRNWHKITTIRTYIRPVIYSVPCTHVRFIAAMYLSQIEAAVREREAHMTTLKDLNDLVVAEQMDQWSTTSTTLGADAKYASHQYEDGCERM